MAADTCGRSPTEKPRVRWERRRLDGGLETTPRCDFDFMQHVGHRNGVWYCQSMKFIVQLRDFLFGAQRSRPMLSPVWPANGANFWKCCRFHGHRGILIVFMVNFGLKVISGKLLFSFCVENVRSPPPSPFFLERIVAAKANLAYNGFVYREGFSGG